MLNTKNPMFKVHFYLRNFEKAKADEACTIYCQLEIEGRNRDNSFSTKIKIPKKYWKNTACSQAYVWADEVNNRLEKTTRTFKEIYQFLSMQFEDVSYHQIRELYDPKTSKAIKVVPKLFFEVLDEMVDKKKIAEGTRRNYEIRKTNLQSFFKFIGHPNPLASEIRYSHIEKMLEYFPESWSNGHRKKHCNDVNQVVEFAIKKEYVKFNPIGKLYLPGDEEHLPKYLSPEQREKIKAVSLPTFIKIRDISIFLWNTGLSYTDYCSLGSKDILHTVEGSWIKKKRQKSKIYSLIPILKDAASIIEKYGEVEKLPKRDLSDFNKDLKFLGDIVGINEQTIGWNLSSSVYRETFASMMENEYMIEERTIMFMMGHKSRKQLNKYSNIMPTRMKHELDKSKIQIFNFNKKAS